MTMEVAFFEDAPDAVIASVIRTACQQGPVLVRPVALRASDLGLERTDPLRVIAPAAEVAP